MDVISPTRPLEALGTPEVRESAAARSRAATRGRLLSAGRSLFAQRGLHGVTTHDIARAAGVAAGTFYLHFTDKSELFREVAHESVAALQARIVSANAGASDNASAVRARTEALVTFVDENRELARILFSADTDAAAVEGFDEALRRVDDFAAAGADLTFLEAPEPESQMARNCAEVPGHKVVNMVEDGLTPWLSPEELTEIGYSVVLYPVSLLLHGARAMGRAAEQLRLGVSDGERAQFDEIRSLVGWPAYEDESAHFGDEATTPDPKTADEEVS